MTACMVGLKNKWSRTQKSHLKMMNPTDLAGNAEEEKEDGTQEVEVRRESRSGGVGGGEIRNTMLRFVSCATVKMIAVAVHFCIPCSLLDSINRQVFLFVCILLYYLKHWDMQEGVSVSHSAVECRASCRVTV